MSRNNLKVSEFFWAYEMACPHCARLIVRPELSFGMDEIRKDHGAPITPSSWCRCLVYNADVYDRKRRSLSAAGSTKKLKTNNTSPHIIGPGKGIVDFGGWAVDFPVVYDLNELDDREAWFQSLGFVGAGFASSFTHLDMKPRHGVKFRSWIYNDGRATARTVKER